MSTPDLHARAARFFLLAEQASRLPWQSRTMFWKMSAASAVETVEHMPGLMAAVRKEQKGHVLWRLARYPLPVRLSPETVPWHDALIAAWEIHYASLARKRQKTTQLALVRLDGCGMPDGMQRPSRLPEWLAEARRIVGAGYEPARTEPARTGEWRVASGMEALAALAAWRPAPGVVTSPETLREWAGFWQEVHQSGNAILKGIAAKALLNLPEADLRAASIRPVPAGQLLHDLATAIPKAAEITETDWPYNHLHLLDWQPTPGTSLPVAGLTEVAQGWLDISRHASQWDCWMVSEKLVGWNRTGALNACGMNVLTILVETADAENSWVPLWGMGQWSSATNAVAGADFALLRELEAGWQQHRQDRRWLKRQTGWLGSIGLYQAGLASELPAAFLEAYLSAVARESDVRVLFVLAQWAPGPNVPPDVHRKWQWGWQCRLEDMENHLRDVAVFALARHALENEAWNVLHRAALKMWRAGTKEATEAYRQLLNPVSRFHEVRAHLATGRVPDFEKIPSPPVKKHCPKLVLPPGRIADRRWRTENEKSRIEN